MANLFARHSAKKEFLTESHIAQRLQFAKTNLHRDWSRVIFSDASTFSSASNGPVVVYRPGGTRYDPRYISYRRSYGRLSVSVWGWMSSDNLGSLHKINGRLTGTQYIHILENVMVPSVREHYPDGVIQFQQDKSPIHTCRVVNDWFRRHNEIQVLDWPPRGADMNPIENVWAEVKRTVRQKWPNPPPSTSEALWDVVQNAWQDVAVNRQEYARHLVDRLSRRMDAAVEAGGHWTSY